MEEENIYRKIENGDSRGNSVRNKAKSKKKSNKQFPYKKGGRRRTME